MTRVRALALLSPIFAALACPNVTNPPVTPPVTPPGPDVPVVEGGKVMWNGTVKNWASLNYEDGARVTSYGLQTPLDITSGDDGAFSAPVDAASRFWAKVEGPGLAP